MKTQRYKEFASALRDALDRKGVTMQKASRLIGCGDYSVRSWLGRKTILPSLPGGKHGPKVLELFGLDSREYGANWQQGFGGNPEV